MSRGVTVRHAVSLVCSAMLLVGAPTPARAASALVTVRLVFDSCAGCRVTAMHGILGADNRIIDDRTWTVTVRSGVASFRVPTKATVGMAFTVADGRYGAWQGGNAMPVIGLAYEGSARGSKLGTSVVRKRGQRANWCWAGTTTSATIVVHSLRTTEKTTMAYENPRQVSFWAYPTVATWHNATNWHGGMGTQDRPWCR